MWGVVMDFFLNKIDPQLVKIVQEVTSPSVIHKKNDVPIFKEEKDRESKGKFQRSLKKYKEKVKEINALLAENNIDIFLVLDTEKDLLKVKVLDKTTDTCLRTFDENEIEELIKRLEDLSGIIVDVKK